MTKIVKTDDGSHTIFSDQFGVHYHSTFGAIQESRHIFLEAGFKYLSKKRKNVSILEVGFGTGLNALLTAIESEKSNIIVDYIGIEAFPLDSDTINELNYHSLIDFSLAKDYFLRLHKVDEATSNLIHNNFKFQFIVNRLESVNLKPSSFDVVYFDAFDPEIQPELWTEQIFTKLFDVMNKGGVLVTYSCKGIVKRALKAAGFSIEKLPGPIGKREILRATK